MPPPPSPRTESEVIEHNGAIFARLAAMPRALARARGALWMAGRTYMNMLHSMYETTPVDRADVWIDVRNKK